jgi:hypothetical protein
MSAHTPHQRGKSELAGAIDDLVAQIEREREGVSPSRVTYDTWVAKRAGFPQWTAKPLPYQGSGGAGLTPE